MADTEEIRLARWYEIFLDQVKAAHRRGYGIATNKAHESAMKDMMERVFEDELYPFDDLPPLVVHRDVPPGEYRMVDKATMQVLSMQAAMNSNTGLGRFQKVWTPDESIRRSN